jgi:hypothetical protein
LSLGASVVGSAPGAVVAIDGRASTRFSISLPAS